MRKSLRLSASAVVVTLSLSLSLSTSCDATPSKTTAAPTTPAVQAVIPDGPLGQVLSGYEAMRGALAADTLAPLSAQLTTLQAAVTTLQASERTTALQAAVQGLQTALSADKPSISDVRVAYGELSRAVVGVIAVDASLQQGRFLFECPMAKGYKRWVQVKAEMENPYMGQRMLACGSSVASWGAP